jgi:hypothetical protein
MEILALRCRHTYENVIPINTCMVLDKFHNTMLPFLQCLSRMNLPLSGHIVYLVNHIALTRGRLIKQGGEGPSVVVGERWIAD